MGNEDTKFTNQHIAQYNNIANDFRFYAEQRFKIVSVFMLTNGILANIASNHRSIILGLIGIILGYLCLSWEKGTTQWWGILFEKLKDLEKIARTAGFMVDAYTQYPRKTPWGFVKATHAVESIYYLVGVLWGFFIIYSWPSLW